MRWSTSELTAYLGGELVGPDVSVEGASIDSRTIQPGQLYAPIVAVRDGHAFIPAALEAGAPAYLTAQEPVGGTAIRVRDTAAALLSLGDLARGRVGGAIGITGPFLRAAVCAAWQEFVRGERRDSNPRPPGPQPGALPAELRPPRGGWSVVGRRSSDDLHKGFHRAR